MAKRKAISKSIRFEVFKRDSFKCQYCGRSAPEIVLHVDHIDPVASGGDNDILNLITSCQPCNLGKGARRLSDATAIQKAKSQMDELQERREQLEMLMAWRNGLRDIKQESASRAAVYWKDLVSGYSISEAGIRALEKLVNEFGLDDVIVAMDDSTSQYLKYGSDGIATHATVNKAFSGLGPICKVNQASREKPHLKDLYRIRGLMRSKMGYFDNAECLHLMEVAYSWGSTIAEIRRIATQSGHWSAFANDITELILELQKRDRG